MAATATTPTHLFAALLSLTIVSNISCGGHGGARIGRPIPDCIAAPLQRAAAGQAIGLVLSGSTLQVFESAGGSREAVQCADTRIATVKHAKKLVDAVLTERASLELVNDPNDHASSSTTWSSLFPSHIQPAPGQIVWVLRVVKDSMPETGLRKLLDDSQFRNNECNEVDGLGRWAPGVEQKQLYVNWGKSGFGFDVFIMTVQALMASISTGTPSMMVPGTHCWSLRHYTGTGLPTKTPKQFYSKEYKSPCAWHYAQGICKAADPSCIFLPVSPCRRPPLLKRSVWIPDDLKKRFSDEGRSKGRRRDTNKTLVSVRISKERRGRSLPLSQILRLSNRARGDLLASTQYFKGMNTYQWYLQQRGNGLEAPLEKAIVNRLPETLSGPGQSLCQGAPGKCNERMRFGLYQYATRPNWRFREAVRRQVDDLMERSGLREADRGECVVMHARRGDVALHYNALRRYVKVEEYLEAAEEKSGMFSGPNPVRHVFLITDSQSAVDEAEKITHFKGQPIKISWLERPRSSSSELGWENHIVNDNRTQEVVDMLTELAMAAETRCKAFLHSTSNFAEIIWSHMCAASWDRPFSKWECPVPVRVKNRVGPKNAAEKRHRTQLWEYRVQNKLFFDPEYTWPPGLDPDSEPAKPTEGFLRSVFRGEKGSSLGR